MACSWTKAAAVWVGLAAPALAQPGYEVIGPFYLPDNDPEVIVFYGDITAGVSLDFERALQRRPNATTLELASNGGNVYGGLTLALEVYEHQLDTVIPAETWCYSACAYVFLAGDTRTAHGELGVHQISGGNEADITSAQFTVADIIETMNYFGVHADVVSLMFRTPPEEMYVFSRDELAALSLEREASEEVRVASLPEPTRSPVSPAPPPNPEAVTVMAKTTHQVPEVMEWERHLPLAEASSVAGALTSNGMPDQLTSRMIEPLGGILPSGELPAGSLIKILFGPANRESDSLLPYRMSLYAPDENGRTWHQATVALSDTGKYILGMDPAQGDGPKTGEIGLPGKRDRYR